MNDIIIKYGPLSLEYDKVGDYLLFYKDELVTDFASQDRAEAAFVGVRDLLEQVAQEQRKLCYESHWDMTCEHPDNQFEEDNIMDAIIDAPSPLNKDSHE